MKIFFLAVAMFLLHTCFAQSAEESNVLKLSKQIFNWEVNNQIDSLEKIFNQKFVVVGSSGEAQNKEHYIKRLRSGDFIHHSIEIETDTAIVANNTATVFGKGTFTVTASGKKLVLKLSYVEVFARSTAAEAWSVLAMKANAL